MRGNPSLRLGIFSSLVLLCACASIGRANIITETADVANVPYPITGVANTFPLILSLSSFNPNLGTLTNVQLTFGLTVSTDSSVLNTAEMFIPLEGLVPIPLSLSANSTTQIFMTLRGNLIAAQNLGTANGAAVLVPAAIGDVTTIAPLFAAIGVSPIYTSLFSSPNPILPLNLNAFEDYLLTQLPDGPSVTGPSPVLFSQFQVSGFIEALYTYTPKAAAPEPGAGSLLLLGFLLAGHGAWIQKRRGKP